MTQITLADWWAHAKAVTDEAATRLCVNLLSHNEFRERCPDPARRASSGVVDTERQVWEPYHID